MKPLMTVVHGVLGSAVPVDRHGSRRVARGQLDHGLAWLGMPTPEGEPQRTTTGRPRFVDAGFDYSCSHDRGAVVVATSTGRVGVDVVADRTATPHIWSFLQARNPRTRARHAIGLGRLSRDREALLLWTRFEAEVKFHGGSVWHEWAASTSGQSAHWTTFDRSGTPTVHSWIIRAEASQTFLSVATLEDEVPPLEVWHTSGVPAEAYPVEISKDPALPSPVTRLERTPTSL